MRAGSRRSATVAALVVVAALVAACASDAPPEAAADDVEVVLVLDDVFYAPDRIELPAGERARVLLRNDGGIVHDLVFDGWESGEVRPGQSVVVELGPLEAPVVAWCSIPGHRDAGMQLEIGLTP